MSQLHDVASWLTSDVSYVDDEVKIELEGLCLGIRSNSAPLLKRLEEYFEPFLANGTPDVIVKAVESDPLDESVLSDRGFTFRDWRRVPAKTGRKDSCCDLPHARLVRKVRTGMLFLQSRDERLAYGPCLQNDNQVINFINSQYMNWLQHNGALICHAAGVVQDGVCFAVAGFSGCGKSTLALNLLDRPEVSYLTNDRLMLNAGYGEGATALGIAKLPRVNPGTILGLPALHPMLDANRLAELSNMVPDVLWELEQKHDVDIPRLYGPDRIALRAPLAGILILNWKRDATEKCVIRPVDLARRPDLLAALTKSPGPFYHCVDGSFQRDDVEPCFTDYLRDLNGVPTWEATGKTDFQEATSHFGRIMEARPCSKS